MSQLNDAKFAALGTQGHTGSLTDRYLSWLQANGATSNSIPDAERELLLAQGAWVDPTRSLNDAWFVFLGSQGHTGALNDRWLSFWLSGGSLGLMFRLDNPVQNTKEVFDRGLEKAA